MALTLAQAKQLSQDKLTDMIIDEFEKSNFINSLTFDNTVKPQGGRSLTYAYNRITTQPKAGTRPVNGVYTAQETVTTQESVDLKIMGGSYKLDRALVENETQVVEHVEFQTAQKSKATVATFHDLTINGDSAVNADEFDGLEKALTGSTTELVPSAVIDMSNAANIVTNTPSFLYFARQLIKQMDGAPTHFLMNSDLWAIFQSVSDNVKSITFTRNELGDEIGHYGKATFQEMGDKPGTTEPVIPTDESDGTTSLYAVRLAMDGVHGVSPEGNRLVKRFLPDFSQPGPVKEGEVEFIGALAIKTSRSAAVLRKIKVV